MHRVALFLLASSASCLRLGTTRSAYVTRRAAVGLVPALTVATAASALEAPPTLREIQLDRRDEAAIATKLSVAELVANTRKDKEALMGRPMTAEEVADLEAKIRDLCT